MPIGGLPDPTALLMRLEKIKTDGENLNEMSKNKQEATDMMQSLLGGGPLKDILGIAGNVLGMLGGKGI